MARMDWLEGTWEVQNGQNAIFESWKKQNDTTLQGISYKLLRGDTILLERIQLLERNDSLLYMPTVSDQNQGRTITFTAIKWKKGFILFENPDHDFPQQISYQRVASDSLLAVISGIRNGLEQARKFPMKRVKTP